MRNKNPYVFLITIFSFFVIFIPFSYHGAVSDTGEIQYDEMDKLKKKALQFGENGTALSYELRKEAWSWAIDSKEDFSFHEGLSIGSIGGIILSTLTYFCVNPSEKTEKMKTISNITLLKFTTIPVVASFILYRILANITEDKHLIEGPIDIGIFACYSLLLGLIIFLHYSLTRRIENLRTKSESKLKLEHDTWKQVLSLMVHVTLLLFGSILISIFISTNEVKDVTVIKDALYFVGMMIIVLTTFFFGIFFGIYSRIISHLSEIIDLLP
jgi:hypothetical protein